MPRCPTPRWRSPPVPVAPAEPVPPRWRSPPALAHAALLEPALEVASRRSRTPLRPSPRCYAGCYLPRPCIPLRRSSRTLATPPIHEVIPRLQQDGDASCDSKSLIAQLQVSVMLQSEFSDQLDVAAVRSCGAGGSSSEFDSTIWSLDNNLHPERLSRVLDSTSDSSVALRIFRWASHQRANVHTVDTYSCMIFKLAGSGNRDEMDGLVSEMVRLKVPALGEAMNHLVQTLNHKNLFDEALLVVQHACSQKLKLPVSACNGVLRGLLKQGKGLRVFMLAYMEIVKAGVLPDVETLNCLIEALCQSGRLDLALIQFDRMNKKRCAPNSHTFEVLITALCSCSREDEAVKLFDKMLQLRCTPDRGFYAQVMPLFCKSSKVKEVVRLYQIMKEDGHQLDIHLYGALVRCLCENQLLNDAVMVFKEIIVSGLAPMTSTYVDLVDCYCTLAKFHNAVSFLEDNGITESEPYNVLLKWFCKSGRLQDSVSYLDRFHRRGLVDYHSWNIVIGRFCNEGDIRRASELIGRMGSCMAGNIHDAVKLRLLAVCTGTSCYTLDEYGYNVLLHCFLTKETTFEAAILFNRMVNHGFVPDQETFELLVNNMAWFSFLNMVAESLLKVVNTSRTVSPRIYNIIIYGLIKEGFKSEASKFLDQMLEKGWVPDSRTHRVLVGTAVEEEARDGGEIYQTVDDDNVSSILLEGLD
ncbi:hypothetical protein PR202_gb10652 [Eleusine coracana subsp. coracana]|uniref:Pentatricopeptide repeat-containing protein n=1 Tax=Eleusine coracana subsp. coracana TaxID=191504 RepID=A0AAV5EKC7_ELECO|nr:hypothetical protein PR202_gb10652 [Eleusine coracana subsp. coracana]